MYKKFTKTAATALSNSAMGRENIQKSRVSLKSDRSRGNFIFSILLFTAGILFSACQMQDEYVIDISQNVIIFEHTRGSNWISLSRFSDNDEFSVFGETDWCTVSQEGTGVYTVIVTENKSSEKRQTTLIFEYDKYNKAKVEVTQTTREIDEANRINGVVINGITWATCNVDAPGTFAALPENAGMFYQWNRKVAYPVTGEVTKFDKTIPSGTTWAKSNDPSPSGWRVPTRKEIESLFVLQNGWGTLNGVKGLRIIDTKTGNSLFLPSYANYRVLMDTSFPCLPGLGGHFWSSTPKDDDTVYELGVTDFYPGNLGAGYNQRGNALSIRSVKE